MHVGKLMARLNPKNVRFDVGAGGIPELTPQDIAAALGMVEDGIGRDLLIHMWWPDGGKRQRAALDAQLTQLQLQEFNCREQAMYAALMAVACGEPGEQKRAHAAYASAHANRWPSWIAKLEPLELSEGYGDVRRAALEELVHPRICPDCHGHGHASKQNLVVICGRCEGAGKVPFGPTWRSKQLGMKEASYKKTWERPYEWLFSRMVDALSGAERDFSSAIK